VKHQTTSKTYALKILDKEQIVSHHQVKGVMREKEIMDSLKHPFIVGLVATFKDDAKLYMLVNLYQGGELFSVLHTRQYDGVPADHAAFYAQCIMIGLAHMHDRKICYRDLKPENVMIDNFGYPVIVDLGFAKIVPERTYTLCGTPEYLAPEVRWRDELMIGQREENRCQARILCGVECCSTA
jgi:protein kinase A